MKELTEHEAKMVDLVGRACFADDKESRSAICEYLKLGGDILSDSELALRIIEHLKPKGRGRPLESGINSIHRDWQVEARKNELHEKIYHDFGRLWTSQDFPPKREIYEQLSAIYKREPETIKKIVTKFLKGTNK